MLSFLKSKPKLSELIPNNYIDIHSHVLPGIDDGAKNIEDSFFLMEEMKKMGFKKCITTPHTMNSVWDNTPESIEEAHIKITSAQKIVPVELRTASEYLLDESVVIKAQKGQLLTLKDNFILVELSYLNPPIQLYDFIYQIQLSGYNIVIAHPERYTYFHSNKKELKKLKKSGCLFQLNLLATVGYYGKDVARIASYLLKENMYDFAGSDIHHKNHIYAFQSRIKNNESDKIKRIMKNNDYFF